MQAPEKFVLHRRFDRIGRLLGDQAMGQLAKSHVMIFGIGGVGSWAAESLARSGVGQLTLVDFDEVCVTNANRQLHALQSVIGQKKATVMADRIKKINPLIEVTGITEFYSPENSEKFFNLKPDFVLDCIDNITAKCHLLSQCKSRNIPVITSAGSGARMDPLRVKCVDIGQTHSDPLVQNVRRILRSQYQFPSEGNMGIPCVFSDEEVKAPESLNYDGNTGFKCVCPQGENSPHGCEKRNLIYGTASFVTGTFGFVMASKVVEFLTKRNPSESF